MAPGPPFLNQATRGPCSLTSLSFCGVPSVWQFMHRNRIAQTFDSNDSSTRSFRACRTTATGFVASAGVFCGFGAFRSFGSAAQASIQAANASYSASRFFAGIRFAPALSSAPRLMSRRIFESPGLSRSMSPWSRSARKVSVADGRM